VGPFVVTAHHFRHRSVRRPPRDAAPASASSETIHPPVTERALNLSAQIVEREPLDQSQGNSGNAIERIRLSDGRRLVLKRVSPEWDWLSRATNDDGRIATMWEHGLFDRIPATIDHATVGVERDDNAWNIFMKDVAHAMLPEDVPHDRPTVRRLLAAVADLHLAFWNEDLPSLCTIEDRYGMLSLRTAEREKASGNEQVADLIFRAWDAFDQHAPRDVADLVAKLSEDSQPIADELRKCSQTLIHGDLRIGNAGFTRDSTVLIDWGDRTGAAPPAVELAWFIGFDAKRLGVSRDELVEDFRELYGERFEQRALDLALIGGFVQLAAHIGIGFLGDDQTQRALALEELEWWTRRVERALETWSPPS
jgi:aminoglycoside phosphotransferase (APT) family kinase protein